MSRLPLVFVLAAGAAACSGGDDSSPAGQVDAGFQLDAFVPPPPPSGPPDFGPGGVTPDGGLSTSTSLIEGLELIGGAQIYAHVRGTTTSTMPPVIFVATGPFLGSEYMIEPMAFLLGPDGQTPDRLQIFFDMRATGRSFFTSTSTSDIDLDTHVDDLGAVMDWVETWNGPTPQFDIVGHGYGAGIGVLYTADNPDRVSRLVLVTPHPATVQQHSQWYGEWTSRLGQADLERLQALSVWGACGDRLVCSLQYWGIMGPEWLCDPGMFNTMTFEAVNMEPYTGRGYINRDLRERQFDWTDTIARINKPTTIIAGTCDPIPAEAARVYRDNIAGSRLHVLDDSGHFPFVESAERFQRIVKQALTY